MVPKVWSLSCPPFDWRSSTPVGESSILETFCPTEHISLTMAKYTGSSDRHSRLQIPSESQNNLEDGESVETYLICIMARDEKQDSKTSRNVAASSLPTACMASAAPWVWKISIPNFRYLPKLIRYLQFFLTNLWKEMCYVFGVSVVMCTTFTRAFFLSMYIYLSRFLVICLLALFLLM